MSLFNLPYDNSGVTVELDELVRAGVKIWDFEYDSFYTGDAKTEFEQKVIDRYRFRQIGQETPARWLHYFRTRVREIAPYYKQLYNSVELMLSVDDPFKAYDLTETYTEERSDTGTTTTQSEGSSTSTSTGTSEKNSNTTVVGTHTNSGTHKMSNTPQGSISNLDNYLTEATVDSSTETVDDTNATLDNETSTGSGSTDSETTATGTTDNSGTMQYTLTRQGNIGVQPLGQEIEAYRKALINVDTMFIDELADLFLLIY